MAVGGQDAPKTELPRDHDARTVRERKALVSHNASKAIDRLVDLLVGQDAHRLREVREAKQRIIGQGPARRPRDRNQSRQRPPPVRDRQRTPSGHGTQQPAGVQLEVCHTDGPGSLGGTGTRLLQRKHKRSG